MNIDLIKQIIRFQRSHQLIQQGGYTLVETLVASAIMMGVLIPSTFFLSKMISVSTSRDLVIASHLAIKEIEMCVALEHYKDSDESVVIDGHLWRILREVQNKWGYIDITVSIFRGHAIKPLVRLTTGRYIQQTFE